MSTGTTANRMVTLLRDEQELLAGELSALPEVAWSRPSPCAGWTLADVVAHLAVQGTVFGGLIRMGVAGEQGPPPPITATTSPEYRAQRDALVRKEAALPPAQILADFKRTGSELVALVESMSEADFARPAFAWSGGPRPAGNVLSGRIFEMAIHHWDVRRSLGPKASIPADLHQLVVNHLRTAASHMYHGSGDAGPVRLEFADQPPMTWLLSSRGGKLTITDTGDASAVATVRTDRETFGLVAVGRYQAGEMAPGGVWQVQGDPAAVQRLFAGFTGY